MARTNGEGKTEFARYLREKRMQTGKKDEAFKPKGWPLTQAEFCKFINKFIKGRKLSVSAYIRMENGGNPREKNVLRIREVLERVKLPMRGRHENVGTGDTRN